MNFLSENLLIEAFLRKPKSFFNKATGESLNRYYVLREFDSGYGIADIVIGSFRPYLSCRSLRSSIDPNWVSPLIEFQKRASFSSKDFAEKYGISISTARDKINQFWVAGFLKKNENSTYSSAKTYRPEVGMSLAIEAKLKNWKQALNQARRYKRFAQYSYVLLDKQYSTPAEANIEVFKQHNVGLISMNGLTAEIHFAPKRNDILSTMYFYRLNEAVYSYFKQNYGCSEEFCSK
ncbi:MAG TPA: hypothetical protein DCS48_01340 [Desulfovibrio sp.]|nr:hypothetical protein [Desulfovibrio sp.]